MEKDNKRSWRKLDNSAKLFPIISNKKFSSVFRLSVVLKKEIKPDVLQIALEKALNIFIDYRVRLRKGFFWYYLEYNDKIPKVKKEDNYPCKHIDKNSNNGYLFQVTYYNKKVNLDVFHSLTDGVSGMEFLKEIIYSYLEIVKNEDPTSIEDESKKIQYNTDDEYLKNYDKNNSKREKSSKAYLLKGKQLPFFATGVIHQYMDLDKLKVLCKSKQATITEYLTASLIYAILKRDSEISKSKRPIKICIPIDLKRHYGTETIANFFSYITIESGTSIKEFDDILEVVKQDFKEKLTEEGIKQIMSSNVKLGTNIFIKMVPLFIKLFSVKLSYIEVRKYSTATLSNVGKVEVVDKYKDDIDSFMVLIAPDNGEKIKCSACSYDNKFIFTFTSILQDKDVQDAFCEHLRNNGIDVEVESNGVYDEFISKD